MSLIDAINWVGRRSSLRPLGLLLHGLLRRLSLAQMVALAGRRMGGPIYGACLADLGGASVRDHLQDGRLMFQAIERFVCQYRPDLGLSNFADLSAEAEACGCQVKMPQDSLPSVVSHPVASRSDLKSLRLPRPGREGRLGVFVESTRLFRRRFCLLAIAAATGPFTLAAELMGAEDIARKLYKDPELVLETMEFALEVVQGQSAALIQAGADIIALGDPTCSLLSAKSFARFVLPFHQRLVASLSRPVLLHVCGNANQLVELLGQSGAQALSLDAPTDLKRAAGLVPPGVVLYGNLSPVEMMMQPAEQVLAAARELLEEMAGVPGFMLGSGCDLPVGTPLENLAAMMQAVRGG